MIFLKDLEQAVLNTGDRVKTYQNFNPRGDELGEYMTCCITEGHRVLYHDRLTGEVVFNHEVFTDVLELEAYLDNK